MKQRQWHQYIKIWQL